MLLFILVSSSRGTTGGRPPSSACKPPLHHGLDRHGILLAVLGLFVAGNIEIVVIGCSRSRRQVMQVAGQRR
jgi:hypothetical protein